MITLFRNLFLLLLELTQSPIASLLLLSLITGALMHILNRIFAVFPKREAHITSIMEPQIREINRVYRGGEAQYRISRLYKRYRYHPILALRSALPLFFQLPFLFAVYHALKDLPELAGVSVGIIRDLSQPDSMILGYNILPFVMTGVNLLTAVFTPGFRLKDLFRAFAIAMLFLALLYKAPSALLIYWTTNNLIFLVRGLIQRFLAKESGRHRDNVSSVIGGYLPDLQRKLLLPFVLLIFLMNLFQYLADGEGIFIYRFSKTVPLLLASFVGAFLMLKNGHFPRKKLGLAILAIPLPLVILAHLTGIYLIPSQRYVIFAWLAGFYLLICVVLAGYQWVVFRKNDSHGGNALRKIPLSSGRFLLRVVLLFTPSLHLAASNPGYLSAWFYPLFLLLPFIIFALAWFVLRLVDAFIPSGFRDGRLNIDFALSFSVLFCYLPVIRAMMQKNSAHDGDFWVILLVTMLIIWLYYRKQQDESCAAPAAPPAGSEIPAAQGSSNVSLIKANRAPRIRAVLNILIIVLFISALGNFGKTLIQGERESTRQLQEIPELLQKLKIKEKPNIYLFVYDGLPNPRVFKDQDLPLEPMQELFDNYGYKVYDDTYTIGNESLNSMAMTLNISDEQYESMNEMQEIYSGNSVVNLFLTGAGYGSYNLLENYFTGTYAITNEDLVTEYFPPKELTAVQSDFFLTLLRGVFQGEFRFDTKGIMVADQYTEADRQNRKHELIRDGNSPKFVIDQVSKPSHSQNSGQCLPNETELWIERYEQALEYLERDLEALEEHDPEAIAVFIGDHGPSLLGDCYVLQNWKLEDITPELMWDRIGTLAAVRWPDPERAEKYDQDFTINQDLFPIILSYLADDPSPLELCPDRTFSGYELLTRPAVKFRSGEMVD